MKHLWTLPILALYLLKASASANDGSWQDEDQGTTITWQSSPAPQNEESLREEILHQLEEWLQQDPILPIKVEATTIKGLPAINFSGVLMTSPESLLDSTIIAFSDQTKHTIRWRSSEDLNLEILKSKVDIQGSADDRYIAFIADTASEIQEAIIPLRRTAMSVHHEAFAEMQRAIKEGDEAVMKVKETVGDLAPQLSNAAALNRLLREQNAGAIYGWGSKRIEDRRHSVTFIFETPSGRTMFVWKVDSATGKVRNVSANEAMVKELSELLKLNLPAKPELMDYDPDFDMMSFKNSDFYYGRGRGPLNEILD